MPRAARKLALTPDHVARVHRVVADGGVPPGFVPQTDADYAQWVDDILRARPDPRGPIRLFAYGSLIWKPELDHRGEQVAVALGWHRSFCFHMKRFRGTIEQPGLMMALDRGGQCRGMLFDLPTEDEPAQLGKLFRREFTTKPLSNVPRWITVKTASGSLPALGFVINRASPLYAGRLTPDEVARVLARSCGHWGTGAEYLLNTVSHLEAKGIHDSALWHLQQLVAARIEQEAGEDI